MTAIALVCLVITLLIFGFVGLIAVRNPVMFKTGLRNIPRRPAQTTLIVFGLMLSTLIITAAFGTGDTLTSSVTSAVYGQLGEADELIRWDTEKQAAPEDQQVIPQEFVAGLQEEFAGDADIEAIIPALYEPMPLFNTRSRLNEAGGSIAGYNLEDLQPFGGLVDLDGNQVTLTGNQIAVNEDLAEEIDAQVGDTLTGYFRSDEISLVVAAIVPTNVFGGVSGGINLRAGTVNIDFLREVAGKPGVFDAIFVSNVGDTRSGLDRSDVVTDKLNAYLEGSPYQAEPFKADNVEFAELLGNVFTTFFIVLGLFSIAAGVLLIFLIFVMLAAERKPEMGMARAVGAKRSQIVESFLAEGMGYDLGAAIVGLIAGMGVTFLMVTIIEAYGGEALGLNLAVTFSWRGLLVAFCLGIITTFLVIFISSWRASRLNIVSAIRDLPESKPMNLENSTWFGFLRATLNAFAAIGFFLVSFVLSIRFPSIAPLASLGMLLGLIGPFFYVLRGSNFAAPAAERVQGERIPLWPFFLILPIPFYLAAMLLVRLTRDRKPASMPIYMLILGILILPVGLVVAALQDRKAPVAWAVGIGTMAAAISVLLVQWGLDSNTAFTFLLGVSLITFWVALVLRYFQIAERIAFTVSSLAILVLWYIPSKWTENIWGPLEGDIEMFFLSGLVMITAGTFVIIYNADIFLPLIARLGSRFGRLVPAIKTGVAYPLTSRFRTGMTMAMIGLIMFALVMISALNTNFANIFLSDDTKGGWDVQVSANSNNPIANIRESAEESGIDVSQIVHAGEVRAAYSFEAEVENIDNKADDDGNVKPFLRYTLLGVDDGFLDGSSAVEMRYRAEGYPTDASVWEAMRNDPTLAIVPSAITVAPDPFAGPTDDVLQLQPLAADFEPFELTVRNPETGESETLTVIAQAPDATGLLWFGIMFGKATLEQVFPTALGQQYFIALEDGADSRVFARELEAGLLTASVDSLDKLLDDQQSAQSGFLLVFQGFMGLGLIVGIAALGVVASRSVVERRQQIGMLRAIGYQRSMVALSFIFESSFIALSGILLGLGLGLSLAWVLWTSGDIGEEAEGFTFIVPWVQIGVISAIAFFASLFMTFLPARAASRVPVAEALRYE